MSDGENVHLLTDDGVMVYAADDDVQLYASVPVITDVTVQAYQQMDAEGHMEDETVILQPFQIDASNTAIRANVVVLVGNGFTQYPGETKTIIEHLAQKEYLPIETKYALFSSCHQPVTYTITESGIAAYQSMLPYMKLSANSNDLSQSDSESSFTSSIEDDMEQLVAGKMTAEQFTRQIDRVASMLWMEQQ